VLRLSGRHAKLRRASEHGPTLMASALRSPHDLSPGGLSPGWISSVGSTRGLAIPPQGSRAAQASSSARTVGTCLGVEVGLEN